MQLEWLKIYCDVVRWASVSKGARENGISQSTASQVVHQIEVRLGVKLIDRSKRPLVPTAQGKIYYEGCKELVSRYLEIENRARSAGDARSLSGTVRVAAIYSVGFHDMGRFIDRFRAEYPEADVRVEYLHPTRVIESVLGDDAELGLISFPRKRTDLTSVPWRDEEMVLAVHPSHRLAGRDEVAVDDLDGERFVGFDHGLPIRRAIDRFLRKHGVHVKVALEFDSIEMVKRAVEVPSGVAILPRPTLSGEVRAGTLHAVRFREPRPTRPLAVIHRRSDPLGLAAARFLEVLTAGEPAAPNPASDPGAKPSDGSALTRDAQD